MKAGDWIMDSQAFTTIATHGGYPFPVSEYAAQIRRWSKCGNLLAAVSQDYMCEPMMLKRTGLTVAEHQRLTIERYDVLLAENTGTYIMPVLQGYTSDEYVSHIQQYGERLGPGAWVGVGSICKRNGNPKAILAVLLTIKAVRPDLLLHGFGLKDNLPGGGSNPRVPPHLRFDGLELQRSPKRAQRERLARSGALHGAGAKRTGRPAPFVRIGLRLASFPVTQPRVHAFLRGDNR